MVVHNARLGVENDVLSFIAGLILFKIIFEKSERRLIDLYEEVTSENLPDLRISMMTECFQVRRIYENSSS